MFGIMPAVLCLHLSSTLIDWLCVANVGTFSILRRVQVQWNISLTCGRLAVVLTTRSQPSMIYSTVYVQCLVWTPRRCSTTTSRIRGYSNRLNSQPIT